MLLLQSCVHVTKQNVNKIIFKKQTNKKKNHAGLTDGETCPLTGI